MLNIIQEDMKQAMRDKDKNRLSTIRMFISRIQNKAKDLKRELTDEEIVEIGQKFQSEIKEEYNEFYKVGNHGKVLELLQSEKTISHYLPRPLPVEDIEKIVKEVINFLKVNKVDVNIGSIMKVVSPMLKGKVGGAVIKEVVIKLLKDS